MDESNVKPLCPQQFFLQKLPLHSSCEPQCPHLLISASDGICLLVLQWFFCLGAICISIIQEEKFSLCLCSSADSDNRGGLAQVQPERNKTSLDLKFKKFRHSSSLGFYGSSTFYMRRKGNSESGAVPIPAVGYKTGAES